MPHVSLLRLGRSLQANSVSDMAKKVGVAWPPAPVISIRNLACVALDFLADPPIAADQEWRNWGITDGPNPGYAFVSKLFKPRGPHEIAKAIQETEIAGKTVRAFGSGWSFSDVALPQSSHVTIKYPDDDPEYYEERAKEAKAFAAQLPPTDPTSLGAILDEEDSRSCYCRLRTRVLFI